MFTIAFYGSPGSFSENAAYQIYGRDIRTVSASLANIGALLSNNSVDAAVFPFHTSHNGLVEETLDYLVESPLNITGEYDLCVHHYLMTTQDQKLLDIHTVMSHPKALDECSIFIKKHGLKSRTSSSTSDAAKTLYSSNDRGIGVIASFRSAALYKLSVVASCIEDFPGQNITRFLIASPSGHTKPNYTTHIYLEGYNKENVLNCISCAKSYHVHVRHQASLHRTAMDNRYVLFAEAGVPNDIDSYFSYLQREVKVASKISTYATFPGKLEMPNIDNSSPNLI